MGVGDRARNEVATTGRANFGWPSRPRLRTVTSVGGEPLKVYSNGVTCLDLYFRDITSPAASCKIREGHSS